VLHPSLMSFNIVQKAVIYILCVGYLGVNIVILLRELVFMELRASTCINLLRFVCNDASEFASCYWVKLNIEY
jgi:hypothetical protein